MADKGHSVSALTHSQVRAVLFTCCLGAFIPTLPYAFLTGPRTVHIPGTNVTGFRCTVSDTYVGSTYELLYNVYVLLLLLICLSMGAGCYIRIARTLWVHAHTRKAHSGTSRPAVSQNTTGIYGLPNSQASTGIYGYFRSKFTMEITGHSCSQDTTGDSGPAISLNTTGISVLPNSQITTGVSGHSCNQDTTGGSGSASSQNTTGISGHSCSQDTTGQVNSPDTARSDLVRTGHDITINTTGRSRQASSQNTKRRSGSIWYQETLWQVVGGSTATSELIRIGHASSQDTTGQVNSPDTARSDLVRTGHDSTIELTGRFGHDLDISHAFNEVTTGQVNSPDTARSDLVRTGHDITINTTGRSRQASSQDTMGLFERDSGHVRSQDEDSQNMISAKQDNHQSQLAKEEEPTHEVAAARRGVAAQVFKVRNMKTDSIRELSVAFDVPKTTTQNQHSAITTEKQHSSVKQIPTCASTTEKQHSSVKQIPTSTLTFMMFLLNAVYMLTFLPHILGSILLSKWSSQDMSDVLTENGLAILLRSYFLSSAVHPLVYGICSKTFRSDCRNLFKATVSDSNVQL